MIQTSFPKSGFSRNSLELENRDEISSDQSAERFNHAHLGAHRSCRATLAVGDALLPITALAGSRRTKGRQEARVRRSDGLARSGADGGAPASGPRPMDGSCAHCRIRIANSSRETVRRRLAENDFGVTSFPSVHPSSKWLFTTKCRKNTQMPSPHALVNTRQIVRVRCEGRYS
jgi:hypothetical protein